MTTTPDVSAIPAGPELDEAVIRLIRFKQVQYNPDTRSHWVRDEDEPVLREFKPSTDIRAAWEVLELATAHCRHGDTFSVERDHASGSYKAGIRENDYDMGWTWDYSRHAEAQTAPIAICRAVLVGRLLEAK